MAMNYEEAWNDLQERLEKAYETLRQDAKELIVQVGDVTGHRLYAKSTGVQLALSYMEEIERNGDC